MCSKGTVRRERIDDKEVLAVRCVSPYTSGGGNSYTERLFKYDQIGKLSDETARDTIAEPAKDLGVDYEEQAIMGILKWS